MAKSSSEKEPLLPKQGDTHSVVDHTVEVEQARRGEGARYEEQQNRSHQSEQLEQERQLLTTMRELFLFLVFTGIEIPRSIVWRMVCVFLYILTGVVFPIVVARKYHSDFVLVSLVVLSLHVLLAFICFGHISRRVWKQGLQSYLLPENSTYHAVVVRKEYASKLESFQFSWICSLISCLVARGIYEIVRLVFMPKISLWMILISILSFIAWTFLSMTILSACNLFGLACRLVIIPLKNFEGYLNQKPPASDIWEELKSIRSHVLQLSSNFSWFLILTFLVVNVSFMLIMLHSLAHSEMIHFIINCDFLLYAIVQVFALSICLCSAANVSNKVLDITPLLCAWRVEELLRSNDGADDTIRHALCEYSRFALAGISIGGYTIDSSAIVGIVFFEIGILQFVLGSQSNLLGAARVWLL